MLITQEEILPRFIEHLSWAAEIDLATAWATSHDGLHDLAIRPIYHQTDKRIEAHIFIAFIAYCLHVTLKQRTRSGLAEAAAVT